MSVNRSIRPQGAPDINITPPVINSFALENGLKIFFNKKSDLPIVRLNVLINCGSKSDPEGQKGLHNLLAMCIDEGAGKFSALELADELEMQGAQFLVSCTDDFIILSLQVLKENFISTLQLIADIITQPHFEEKDFNREKHKVLVRINQSKAEPDYIADIAFTYFLFGENSPYAFPIMGNDNTVQNIQLQSVKSSYLNFFSPLNSSIIVVGDVDDDSLKNELEESFSTWNSSSILNAKQSTFNKNSRRIYIIDKPDSVQTEIRIGQLSSKRSEKDFFQKQIINLVLGGQFSSRLNLNLREKNGYTYGIHSQFNYLKDAGYFAVSTSVDLVNTASALREIYHEIDTLKLGITEDELNFAKSSLTKKFPMNFETYRQVAAAITTKVIHNLADDYFDTYVKKINSMKLNYVNQVANNCFSSEEIISVVVGDSKKIINQIEGTEFGEIRTLRIDEVF